MYMFIFQKAELYPFRNSGDKSPGPTYMISYWLIILKIEDKLCKRDKNGREKNEEIYRFIDR